MANEQAKAFLDQATQSLQNSQFQQSLDLVEQAIAIDSNVSDAYVLKGICLSQLSQPDGAEEAFRKAIMISPYNAKAYYNWAVHQNAQGNKKEAAELAREAVGVDPRHTGARQLLSQLEQEMAGVSPNPVGEKIDVAPAPSASSAPPAGIPAAGPPPSSSGTNAPPASATRPATPASASEAARKTPVQGRVAGSTAHPNANPYEGQVSKSQFSHQGYERQGYDEPSSALPWVSSLGAGWLVIGIVIALLPLIVWLSSINMFQSLFERHTTAELQAIGQSAGSTIRGVAVLGGILSVFWMVCDILDRRSSWWWILLIVVSICCCTNFISMPLYMLVGRKRS